MAIYIDNNEYNFCEGTCSINAPFADNLESAKNMLGPDNTFVFFDLNLTSEEKVIISRLEANDTKSFEQSFNSTFHANYINYLTAIGNNEEVASGASSIIKNFAESYTQLSPESQSALIFGHTTTPEALNSPIDWHIDQKEEVFDIIKYRVSIALKGPSTLFCKLSEDEQKNLKH